MWRYSFTGVCLLCKRWFDMTVDDESPEKGNAPFDKKWWADCPFCCLSGISPKKTVAWKASGGHLLDHA